MDVHWVSAEKTIHEIYTGAHMGAPLLIVNKK